MKELVFAPPSRGGVHDGGGMSTDRRRVRGKGDGGGLASSTGSDGNDGVPRGGNDGGSRGRGCDGTGDLRSGRGSSVRFGCSTCRYLAASAEEPARRVERPAAEWSGFFVSRTLL